ncbi:hypothetical protein CEXT_507731 [Caerostris extrusa]|uniref:Uncharacterized protein n=1 Tax=Caerostris extrusa TaxID=172846 RepID=A0AAV4XDV1_CAEEX|nr:hypothetical protein CEXT_507731 [Caerostris extrusa]
MEKHLFKVSMSKRLHLYRNDIDRRIHQIQSDVQKNEKKDRNTCKSKAALATISWLSSGSKEKLNEETLFDFDIYR